MAWFTAKRNWGLLLLAVWLIAQGLLYFVPKLSFEHSGDMLALLAIAAGVLLLLGR